MAYEIVDDPAAGRFELRVDGERAGVAEYLRRGGVLVVNHLVIDERLTGRGLGSALARGVLDAARGAGVQVVPRCWFLRDYVDRHPEYRDLVSPDGQSPPPGRR